MSQQLNEFQLLVLQYFTLSNRDLVIEAPTGVGKTFTAMLLSKEVKGRVIYAVPLKALVYQIVEDFPRKFNGFSSVIPLLSEVYEDDPDELKEKVVVTTYEKADSVTRRNYRWLDEVKLLVIDEIHNVADPEREKAIENLVVWAKDSGVRIVTMSATVPFVKALVDWLDAEHVKYDRRPVPLYKYVMLGNRLCDDKECFEVKGDLLKKLVKKGKVVMVFASTKKRAEALYYRLRGIYGDKVVYIHAGLDADTRRKILDEVYSGKYSIVVATTVIGQGVNLPFHTVIFDDVRLPVVEQGRFVRWREMSYMEFEQVCGRAGRPGFDTEGMCVVLAENERDLRHYINKFVRGEVNELRPSHNIYDLIIAVMTRHLWSTLDHIYEDVRRSLTFRDYPFERLKSDIDYLVQWKVLGYDGSGFYITKNGQAVGYSYLDIESAVHYIRGIENGADLKELILTSPKVKDASKGEDPKWVIEAWTNGVDEKTILKHSQKLTITDLNRFVSTVSWQAFGLYRILRALDYKEDAKKVLLFHLSVRYGVPVGALALIQLPGIGRKRAMELYSEGIHSKEELCKRKDISKKVLGEKMVGVLCR